MLTKVDNSEDSLPQEDNIGSTPLGRIAVSTTLLTTIRVERDVSSFFREQGADAHRCATVSGILTKIDQYDKIYLENGGRFATSRDAMRPIALEKKLGDHPISDIR